MNNMIDHGCRNSSEKGSVIIWILIGVALFAALSYTVSQMLRSDGGSSRIAEEKAVLMASDILDYARNLRQTVQALKIAGCADTDISFENSAVAGYEFAPPGPEKCRVFRTPGAGMTWVKPPPEVNNGSQWVITGAHPVAHVGTSEDVTRCVDKSGAAREACVELVLVLPNMDRQICMRINESNDVENTGGEPPVEDGLGAGQPNDKFRGEYANNGDDISGLTGGNPYILSHKSVGCFENDADGNYYFYYTLIAR